MAAPSGAVQIDPVLTYTAATAIYQEVQLINAYVSDAALRYGYVPYVVRLQVSVQPYARNEPYDVYVDLGAFTRCRHRKAEKTAFVVPLFVSDDVETGQTSDALNIARQLALSLGGTTGNVAVQAGASNLSDKLNAILGTDFNSLYSVTRAGDNVLQVRFGASRSPNLKAGYSMVTQSHYVTFLLLVDRSYAATSAGTCFGKPAEDTGGENVLDAPKRGPEVWITSYARLRQASTGKELPIDLSLRDERALSIMSRFENVDVTKPPESRARALKAYNALLSDVATNDTDQFNTDFCTYIGCPTNVPWGYVNALWTSITSVMDMSEYAGIVMDLPKTDQPGVDRLQTVFLSDDCKQAATASINVGGTFSAGNFTAFLDLDSTPKGATDKSTLRVAATSVTQATGGGPFVLHFPTLKPLNQLVQGLASACPAQGTTATVDPDKTAAARAKTTDSRAKQLASEAEAAIEKSAAASGPDKTPAAEAATKALVASRTAAQVAKAANAAAKAAAASAPKNKVPGLNALLPGAMVTLQQTQPNVQSRWSTDAEWGPFVFQHVFFSDSTQLNTTVSVLASGDSIAADQTGSGKLRLFVSGGTDLTDVEIQVSGAMLAPSTTTTPLPSVASFLQSTPPYATLLVPPTPTPGQPVVLDVYLQGLIAGRAVTIVGSGRVNSKAVPGSQATVVLPVLASTPAKTSTTPPQ